MEKNLELQEMTVEEMKDRDKWLKFRNIGIGGSEAAVVVGMNKWKSPFQLWLEKREEVERPTEKATTTSE